NFDFMQLLGFGEAAQIHSKKEGLNRLNFYQHELQQIAINNLLIENELKFAIPNQLKIYYQVQHGPNNQNVGCEALIRWDHPTKGVISPDHFITIAEDCGLILSIGYWLFDQVFYQLSLWNKHPNPMYNVPVSLNLSVKQFNDPNLVSHLHDLLKKYQISASLITLEITETIMMENFECFKKIFKILKSFGYMLSLDDFGIGYSSLSVISEIDFDEIKIDKSFINNIVSSSKSQTIVKLIVALAEELSVRIVAEGVEDEKQYEILKSYGVGCFQGFLFSLPRPAEDFK
ncbi:MAG TPA: EAL domain-containing protein, partial [Ferrovaceae bacterium]|nr:EAL domain-containing protein [Ferrovaceae bacterium]